jgi:hypothetical protein
MRAIGKANNDSYLARNIVPRAPNAESQGPFCPLSCHSDAQNFASCTNVRFEEAAPQHVVAVRLAAMGRKYPSLGLNWRCRSALQRIRTPDPTPPFRRD